MMLSKGVVAVLFLPRLCVVCVQIVWTNLGIRFWERNMREIFMWAVLVVIIICFIPVTAALQAIIQASPCQGSLCCTVPAVALA
jgi:hypothetical protein